MEWANKYIGIPYAKHGYDMDGFNCWGLYWYVLKHEFGKDVPSYSEHFYEPESRETLSKFIDEQRNTKELWAHIPKGQEQAGDCLVLLIEGKLLHVGVVVDSKYKTFLHVLNGVHVYYDEYNTFVWKRRVRGFYRYVG